VLCCTAGSSYTKASGSTCFQHVKPGTTPAQCAKPAQSSGFFNKGPGPGTLLLAGTATSCGESVQVGATDMSCPAGPSSNKLRFTISMPKIHK
jgi:hypothetical protein